jgi:hypothetical protein
MAVLNPTPRLNIGWQQPRPPTPVCKVTRDQIYGPNRELEVQLATAKARADTAEARLAAALAIIDTYKRNESQKNDSRNRALVALHAAREAAETILGQVAREAGISVDALRGRDRRYMDVRDRAIMRVAVDLPMLSTKELGRIFDGRDHSTIIHTLKKLNPGERPVVRRLFVKGWIRRKVPGSREALTSIEKREILARHAAGATTYSLARAYSVSPKTIYRIRQAAS